MQGTHCSRVVTLQGYIAGTHNVTFTNGLDVVRHGSRPPAYVARKLHLKPLDEAQQPTPWSTARIVGRICKELDKMARRRADRMRLEHRYADFHRTWVVTGLATYVNGRLRTRVLANWRNPSPQVDAQQPS